MQPPSSSGSSDALNSQGMPDGGADQTLAGYVQSLLTRVAEIERALGAREWWLLGRAFPEAQPLSEIASLLAVVRAELDAVLPQQVPSWPAAEPEAVVSDDERGLLNDPGWVQARRDEAVVLLNQAAAALPVLLQDVQQAQVSAERSQVPAGVVEALGIARDRLREACETLDPGSR